MKTEFAPFSTESTLNAHWDHKAHAGAFSLSSSGGEGRGEEAILWICNERFMEETSRPTFGARLMSPIPCLCAVLVALASLASAAPVTSNSPTDFPYAVPFELGFTQFAPGDSITITELRGTSETVAPNESYCVIGTYTLSSCDEAKLAFFATTPNSGPTPIDPRQMTHITKGSGSFCLSKTMEANGYLHLSFYPAGSGSDFGGVYFGQGDWVRRKGWSHADRPASTAGPNQVIFDFLGEPVPPPPALDPAYSREGLLQAVQLAAQRAGLSSPKSVEIDDSEFPFLVGVVCGEGDLDKLKEQLRKMKPYEYPGSISSSTCAVFNITPWQAFPPASVQRINRRLGVREQILFDRISAQH